MKIVIVGNGVAGTFSAQNIRSLNDEVDIEIFSQEDYLYYTRIKLPELISRQVSIDNIVVFPKEWYKKKNIKYLLNKKIVRINPNSKQIFCEEQEQPITYDRLILALGSSPNIPPIKNAKELLKKGVFTLRNIDDALEIRNYIENNNVKKAIIIGGGLLGLELAKQIKNCKLETTVVEFFPRLLPKQLDTDCGGMLKEVIENMGINVILNAATEEILGEERVKGIKLKDQRELKADIVLIQAGIRANIDLAEETKIKVNKGIIVNQYLETSTQDIFAIGDCIEYKDQTWGIIPACIEQSKIIAASILGKKTAEYTGTVPKNTLKIIGIDLTSVGIFDPEDTGQVGTGWQILKTIDEKGHCYKKIVLKDNKLKGAILFGEKKAIPYINKNIETVVDEEELRKEVEIFKWICKNCGYVYDDAKMDMIFKDLPKDWKCKCGAGKDQFLR
jgi:nitrite reductase (NADH) large subunit